MTNKLHGRKRCWSLAVQVGHKSELWQPLARVGSFESGTCGCARQGARPHAIGRQSATLSTSAARTAFPNSELRALAAPHRRTFSQCTSDRLSSCVRPLRPIQCGCTEITEFADHMNALYLDDAYARQCTATVTSNTPAAAAAGKKGASKAWTLQLSQTVLYPEGTAGSTDIHFVAIRSSHCLLLAVVAA